MSTLSSQPPPAAPPSPAPWDGGLTALAVLTALALLGILAFVHARKKKMKADQDIDEKLKIAERTIAEQTSLIAEQTSQIAEQTSRITDLELALKTSSQATRDAELLAAELSREKLELERRLAQVPKKIEQTHVKASQLEVPTDALETHGLRADRFTDATALRVRLMEHTNDESSQVKLLVTTEVAEPLYGRDPMHFPYDPLLPPLIGLGLFEGAQLIGFCSFEAVPFVDGKSVCAYVDLLGVHVDHEDKEIGKMLLSVMKGMLVVAFPAQEGVVEHHRQVADDIEAALAGRPWQVADAIEVGSGGRLLTEKLPSMPTLETTPSTAAVLAEEQDPSVTALLTPRALARANAAERAKAAAAAIEAAASDASDARAASPALLAQQRREALEQKRVARNEATLAKAELETLRAQAEAAQARKEAAELRAQIGGRPKAAAGGVAAPDLAVDA